MRHGDGRERPTIPAPEAVASYQTLLDSLVGAARRRPDPEFAAGVAAALNYLSGCDIVVNGVRLPRTPYGEFLDADFWARLEGQDWPTDAEDHGPWSPP